MDIFFFFFYDEDTDTTVPVPVDDLEVDEQELEFFFDEKIRKIWHRQQEEWYFSIIDVIGFLTESSAPKKYWSKLKTQLNIEGVETSTISRRFKMKASDGKMRLTDCANTEQLLRIIQSTPSKKAEPFKQWLAMVGKERLDEMADPELAFERMIRTYRQKGYSEEWITQRLQSIDIRKQLTDEWHRSGIQASQEFASLTNILTKAWSGKTVKQYKEYKGLHKENLRDNMTNIELTLNQLAEVSATALSKVKNPKGYQESKAVAHEGGSVAGNARKELETRLGQSVLSPLNAEDPPSLFVQTENDTDK